MRLCSFDAQDLVVLCKYLIKLKLFCILKIFPKDAYMCTVYLYELCTQLHLTNVFKE